MNLFIGRWRKRAFVFIAGAVLIPWTVAQAGTISGTVTGPDGTSPLADVYVESANVSTWEWGASTYTDENGHYELNDLAAGTYHVRFEDNSGAYAPEVYDDVSGSDIWNHGADIDVGESAAVSGINAALGLASKITGMVTGPDGTSPLADVYVESANVSTWEWGPSTYTDENGHYELSGLAAGTYHVRFVDDSGAYASEVYDDVPGSEMWNHGADVVVGESATVSGINAALALASKITGKVTETGGTTGLADIQVQAYGRQSDGAWNGISDASTDSGGNYEIGGLPAGTYRVMFSDWSGTHVGEIYDDVPGNDVWQAGTEIAVGTTATVAGIDAALALPSKITGTVTAMDGLTVLQDVFVSAYRRSGSAWDWCASGQTDVDGNYELGGLAAGTYRVVFYGPDNYLDEIYDDVSGNDVWQAGTDIAVDEASTRDGIDAALAEYARLSGTVTQADGTTPIAGARVCLFRGARVERRGQTDVLGAFGFSTLVPGTYVVVVQPAADLGVLGEWYDDAGMYVPGQEAPPPEATAIVLGSGENRTGIHFALAPAGRISGVVTGPGGTPIVAGYVKAKDATHGLVVATATDETGAYELRGLLPGNYTLKAGAEEVADEWWSDATHEDRATAFAVASGSDLTCDFDLLAGQNPALVEVVSDPAGAMVYLDYQATTNVTPTVVDVGEVASHSVQLDGWAIASHVIALKKVGSPRPAPRSVAAVEAETTTLTFDLTAAAGSLSVVSEPDGAEVFVDYADAAAGVTPLVVDQLAPGSHAILLRKDGQLQPRPILAQVAAGTTNEVAVPLASALVGDRILAEVQSVPTGAVIYVDYLPTANVTDATIDGLDPASHAGAGWHSASHAILLRKRGCLPAAPRYVPEVLNAAQTNRVQLIADAAAVADEDGDGMPDQWEDGYDLPEGWDVQTAGGDFDADGVSNYGEMIAGTHPGNPDSVFKISQSDLESPGTNDRLAFIFNSVPGRFYLIQGAESFGDNAHWVNLSGAIRATTNPTVHTAAMAGLRFFRLLVWAP